MSKTYGVIYKIINKINGKVYIGQTKNNFNKRYAYKGKGIERVYKYHKYNKENGYPFNNHLLNSIEKYGIENFEVIEEFEKCDNLDKLNEREKYWIGYYESNNNLKGYNETIGGEGRTQDNIIKFIKRLNSSERNNSILLKLIEFFRKDKKGIWDNFGYGINNSDRELVRYYAWNDKCPKKCKYCNRLYRRKYDKNNLCDFCNSLNKDELKQIKKISKEYKKQK